MGLKLSQRSDWVLQSEIRNMSIESDRVGGINLSQGVCDLEVPLSVRQGAKEAMDEGFNSYTRYDGLDEIRQAIALKQKWSTGIDVDPEKEIVVGEISFSNEQTFYESFGDVFGWAIVVLAASLLAYNHHLEENSAIKFCENCRAVLNKDDPICSECELKKRRRFF